MIFPTNQSKRKSDNVRTNEISRYKSQIKVQIVSGMPKVRWKQRKYSKDLRFCKERTSRWMSLHLIALESDVNFPDLAVREDGWAVESLIVPCGILLFGIIAQAGRVEFTVAKSKVIKSIILVSCLVYSSKFKWLFLEHLTPKTRQTIGLVKFDFKTFALCSIEFAFNFIAHFSKNYLENVYCVFCCIFCCLGLRPFDEVV